ncbi:MAG: 23S rRNA (pseudouridine(1915)-N(3))-methyltransferase RlmH [Gemmatimonadota bacterium]|nr:23S rRNA (pseudouridine(1915)-N(3))-methyltransferase RlmH [Gemmatimonadota bacterium]
MKLEILAVGRLRAPWARSGVGEYLERVARYAPVERNEVKPARGEGAVAREEEGERLLAAASIGAADRMVVLDRRGEALSSEGWAKMLRGWARGGVKRVVLVVGGASGLSAGVRESARREVSFGRHTMAHELAQVVLAEQLYRAWTIVRNEPYHK